MICRSGTLHQGNVYSFGQGFQCTIIATVALIALYSSHYTFPSQWMPTVVDEIVVDGSRLYDDFMQSISQRAPRYLAHNEIPHSIFAWNSLYHLHIYDDVFYGIVGHQSNSEALSVNFDEALENSLQISQSLLLTAGDMTVAIFADSSYFYIFDSHARNYAGIPDENGNAVLLCFETIEEVLAYIKLLYTGQQFNLSPVIFEAQQGRTNNFAQINSSIPQKKCRSNQLQQFVNNHTYNEMTTDYQVNETDVLRHFSTSSTSTDMHSDISHTDITNNETLKFEAINLAKKQKLKSIPSANDTLALFDHTYFSKKNEANINKRKTVHKFGASSSSQSVSKYQKDIGLLPKFECKCCQIFLFDNEVCHLRLETATSCALQITKSDAVCTNCFKEIKNDHFPRQSQSANFLDTGSVPSELYSLNSIEKRLVALIQVYMSIVKLPGGQYAERGSVINFQSPYINIASKLPVTDNLIAVKFADSLTLTNISCCIKPSKVLKALSWLKANNPLYKDCTFSLDEFDANDSQSTTPNMVDLEESSAIPCNYSVPNINISDVVNQKGILTLKKVASAPISPYDMQYGEEMAFPWLFPFGNNGFNSQRPMKISMREYFQLRLKQANGIFRKNITYLLNTVNVCDYKQLLSDIGVQMKIRKPGNNDSCLTAKDVTNLNNNPDIKKKFIYVHEEYSRYCSLLEKCFI